MFSLDDDISKTGKRSGQSSSDEKLLTILVMILVTFLFWDYSFFFPFKVFTVYLHELSHGIAAELTGGEMWKITLSARQGGLCYTSGGIREIILSAGYMGSMFWGCLIFYGVFKMDRPQQVTLPIGAIIMVLTFLTVRNSFGIFFGFAFGGGLIFASFCMTEGMNEIIAKLMAITNLCYPIWDICDDLLFRTVPNSDAYRLGQITGISSTVWGTVWLLVSLTVLGSTLYYVTEPEKVIEKI